MESAKPLSEHVFVLLAGGQGLAAVMISSLGRWRICWQNVSFHQSSSSAAAVAAATVLLLSVDKLDAIILSHLSFPLLLLKTQYIITTRKSEHFSSVHLYFDIKLVVKFWVLGLTRSRSR